MSQRPLIPSYAVLAGAWLVLAAAPALALAQTTTGPGAPLTKLDDHWASVPPAAPLMAAVSSSPAAAPQSESAPAAATTGATAPAAALPTTTTAAPTSAVPGYAPDVNYSGACHVTVDVGAKTYVLNPTSSTDMIAPEAAAGRVCMPSESLAVEAGFTREAIPR